MYNAQFANRTRVTSGLGRPQLVQPQPGPQPQPGLQPQPGPLGQQPQPTVQQSAQFGQNRPALPPRYQPPAPPPLFNVGAPQQPVQQSPAPGSMFQPPAGQPFNLAPPAPQTPTGLLPAGPSPIGYTIPNPTQPVAQPGYGLNQTIQQPVQQPVQQPIQQPIQQPDPTLGMGMGMFQPGPGLAMPGQNAYDPMQDPNSPEYAAAQQPPAGGMFSAFSPTSGLAQGINALGNL